MMKKSILFMSALLLTCVQAKADLAPTVMLHHNGQATFYMYYQVQNAVDAAVDGDTIYLSEGTFRPFNVNKRIMVRGAGPTTMVEGNCEIDIPGTEKLNMPVLDAVMFNGNVIVNNAYKQCTLRKCQMENLIFNTEEGIEFYDVKIDRCLMSSRLNLPNTVKEFNAFNSKIWILYPHNYSGSSTFEHCNIASIMAPITGAVFNSCAIGPASKLQDATNYLNLIGCVLNSCYYSLANFQSSNCSFSNCYALSSGNGFSSSKNFWFNYDGSDYVYTHTSSIDGTKIGAYGGQHPFTQWPEVPGVTQYNISIDAPTKTMTVKLTVNKL